MTDAWLDALDPDPHASLAVWLGEGRAAGLHEPEAAALATATPDGRPSVRYVLVRRVDTEGFALQLGLLGLIGRAGGFEGVDGDPEAFEYWSLQRYRGSFGRLMRPDKDMEPGEFLVHAGHKFGEVARDYLTGMKPFAAKLNPAYAPYGDYDQLMRLEEWYGRK